MGAVAHIDAYKEGHYFRNETRGGMSWNGYENNVLLRNLGRDDAGIPQFVDVALAVGADDIRDSRGVAVLDFDHDGDLDVAVNHNPGDLYEAEGIAPGLYRNDIGQARHWLAVELQGTRTNRDGIGAEVSVMADGRRQLRLVTAGSGYASQHPQRVYFGLDRAASVQTLSVRWPGGREEHFSDLKVNQLVRVVEGRGIQSSPLPVGRTNRVPPERAAGGGNH